MPDDRHCASLLAAIDPGYLWVYTKMRAEKTAKSASSFIEHHTKKPSFTLSKVFTGQGKEFTDRFFA
jgi:hypothetical protein